jgi:hypothetical protein
MVAERFQRGAERFASALFGGAVGYAAYRLCGGALPQLELIGCAAAAGAAAFLLVATMFGRLARRPRFHVPVFRPQEWGELAEDELLLTEMAGGELLLAEPLNDELLLTDAVEQAPGPRPDPLVLDDVLAAVGSDSRVVRLFDPKAMPTAGQLRSRIDTHLGQGSAAAAPTDASQALSDALAELKRSLR